MTAVGPRAGSRCHPLTVITPTRGPKSALSWGFLRVMRVISELLPTRQLEFIHFARWQRIKTGDLPTFGDQPPEEVDDDMFLFSTNFNGRWDQYIDTFARVAKVKRGVNSLWWFSEGFPGAIPIRNFKSYIHYHTYPELLYYDAYPHSTVRDIKAALAVSDRLSEFVAASPEACNETEAEFSKRYSAFIGDIADQLASAAALPAAEGSN